MRRKLITASFVVFGLFLAIPAWASHPPAPIEHSYRVRVKVHHFVKVEYFTPSYEGQPVPPPTYTGASCSEADMQAAVNLTSNGDTVNFPTSTSCPSGVTWGTLTAGDVTLSITTGITLNLQGAVILDHTFKGDASCNGGVPLLTAVISTNVPFRITNGRINGVMTTCPNTGVLQLTGNSHQLRVDHIYFDLFATGMGIGSNTFGVIDHNTFNINASEEVFPIHITLESYQGIGNFGDNSYAQPDSLGGADNVYIETNTYIVPSSPSNPFPSNGCLDSEYGARWVFRFNTGCAALGFHGLDTSGRARSTRHNETYNNSFTAVQNSSGNMFTGFFSRGGVSYLFNNTYDDTVSGSPYQTIAIAANFRDAVQGSGYVPWGVGYSGTGCDGRGPFDTNSPTTYASFLASGGSTSSAVAAQGTPGWTTNQWVSVNPTYSIIDTSASPQWNATITANTVSTISYQGGQSGSPTASNGDAMIIRAAYPCQDQIGRGAGGLISGSAAPVLVSTGNTGPVNQASDPNYDWGNTLDGTPVSAWTSQYLHVRQNRDYYNWTSSFTGATGVGTGVLASRPSTCTTGVAYWATDQGNWNQSGAGGQGVLYVCGPTANTWTLQYTPYTYPHPLVTGGSPPPTTPTGKLPLTLNINVPASAPPPVSITPTTMPTITEGVSFSQQFTAKNCGATGTATCQCSVAPTNADGSVSKLPTGVTLTAGCLFSGNVPIGTYTCSTSAACTVPVNVTLVAQ